MTYIIKYMCIHYICDLKFGRIDTQKNELFNAG